MSLRSWALVMATLGICGGGAVAGFIADSPLLLVLAGAIVVPGLAFRRSELLLVAIVLTAGQIGVWRMQVAESGLTTATAQLSTLTGIQQIRGLVSDDPVVHGRTTSLRLSNVLVRQGDEWQALGASVLVNVPHWPDHEYGEYLQLRGRLQALKGGEAVEALRRQGMLGSMSYPQVSYLANPQANPVLIAIFRLRNRLGETISRTLPEPTASTLKATILGLRSALPKDEQQALVDTGTVHLIVISGFKLSLLAGGLQALGLWILRRTTARVWGRAAMSAAVLATVAGYTLMTGATPSGVRAAIMAGAVVLAGLAGRPRDQLSALAAAVLLIMLARPFTLQDAGFQLSCLSVLGISLLAEPLGTLLRRPMRRLPMRLQLVGALFAEAAAVSAAATAFDLPVLAGSFHIVSLVSPLANLLGMPLLWPIMVFGGLGALIGSIVPFLGALLLWPAWAFVTLLDWVVHLMAALPYSALPISGLESWLIALYYAGLLGVVWLLRQAPTIEAPEQKTWSPKLGWAAMAAGALAASVVAVMSSRPPTGMRVSFLAVPGQATLLQTAAGRTVLIDGGQDGQTLVRQLGALLPPWQRTIDAVVLTNAANDHIAGIETVFDRYHVGAFVTPAGLDSSATMRRLLGRLTATEAAAIELGDGDVLTRVADGWRLQHGDEEILIGAARSELRLADGSWRIQPMLRGLTTAADGVLSLAETGNITVSFGLAGNVDS